MPRFRPALLPTIATLMLLPCLLALGFWQLDRAKQKRHLLETYAARLQQAPVSLEKINEQAKTIDYMPVKVSGEFANEHQILVENKYSHHILGYHVLTPMMIKGTSKAILINRGWIPRAELRDALPPIPAVNGTITLRGFVKRPETNPFVINPLEDNSAQWPRRVALINTKQLSQQLGMDLYPFIMLMAPDQPHGFVRDWQPVGVNPARSIGYAVQWFGLALILVIIYISVNLKRRDKHAE